ncbi:hypothetical protein COO60DRAFT_1480626, partial [Scenedesmus sp. NREL 46B-D3]
GNSFASDWLCGGLLALSAVSVLWQCAGVFRAAPQYSAFNRSSCLSKQKCLVPPAGRCAAIASCCTARRGTSVLFNPTVCRLLASCCHYSPLLFFSSRAAVCNQWNASLAVLHTVRLG